MQRWMAIRLWHVRWQLQSDMMNQPAINSARLRATPSLRVYFTASLLGVYFTASAARRARSACARLALYACADCAGEAMIPGFRRR
jgi:hypothetical protein